MNESIDKQREYAKKSYWKNHEKNLLRVREYHAKRRAENREEYNRKQREYNAKNAERINAKRRERLANNPEYAEMVRARDRARSSDARRANRLKRVYGITVNEYNLMLESQGNKCAICGADECNSIGFNFHVDHCHFSGKVRGLLCSECNTGLGKFKDNANFLLKAVEYLNKGDNHGKHAYR